jgi:hypothetical protein
MLKIKLFLSITILDIILAPSSGETYSVGTQYREQVSVSSRFNLKTEAESNRCVLNKTQNDGKVKKYVRYVNISPSETYRSYLQNCLIP